MSNAIAIVEGPTERRFVEESLAPWMAERGVFLHARVMGKFGHKGGVKSFRAFQEEAVMHLKNPHWRVVTTMIDYYGMPPKWNGRSEAASKRFEDKALAVEDAWNAEIRRIQGDRHDPSRYLPYVQMHEFEALLFSDTDAIADLLGDELREPLANTRRAFRSPEEINDDPLTAPSKRLMTIHPPYAKIREGITIAARIGIDRMLSECPHFKSWIDKLLLLGTQP